MTDNGSAVSPQFPVVKSYQFVLSFLTSTVQGNGRRQAATGGYVNSQGQASSNCASAVVYTLSDGLLFANSASSSLQFGTNPGVVWANFTPSASPGTITSIFSVDYNNVS